MATTLNPADLSNVTLSGGNLTATDGGAADGGVRSTTSHANGSGKFYFEATLNSGGVAIHSGCGILTPTQSLTSIGNGNGGLIFLYGNSWLYFNGSPAVQLQGSGVSGGSAICFAIDLTVQRGWGRINGGNWNASGTANPTTNTGGISISGLFSSAAAMAAITTGGGGTAQSTINFGNTALAQAMPGGFATWDVQVAAAQARSMLLA